MMMEEMRLKQEQLLEAQEARGGGKPMQSSVRATMALRDADAAIAAATKAVADYVCAFERVVSENDLHPIASAGVRACAGDVIDILGNAARAMIGVHMESMETCMWNKIDVPVPGTWKPGLPAHLTDTRTMGGRDG